MLGNDSRHPIGQLKRPFVTADLRICGLAALADNPPASDEALLIVAAARGD